MLNSVQLAGDHQDMILASHEESTAVREELDAVCRGTAFRTSRKSCEFLQFVVERFLQNDLDSLKERTIGVDLLGRTAAYDTGSDSAVRVRANEVRRRLQLHYEQCQPQTNIRLELPTGCYVPRFVKIPGDSALEMSSHSQETREADDQPETISVWRLSVPTIIALFLCAICIRWNFSPLDPYNYFWNRILGGRDTIVIRESQVTVSQFKSLDNLRMISPLLAMAGRLRKKIQIVTPGENAEFHNQTVVEIAVNSELLADHRTQSRLSWKCPHSCQLVIEGAGLQETANLLKILTDPDQFPSVLSDQLQSKRIFTTGFAGNEFTLADSLPHPPISTTQKARQ